MTAYGYVRISVIQDPTRVLSADMQEAAIRRLAARNGDEDVVILADLDISGTKRRDRRPAWDQLLRTVEQGEAKSVYAYSLSRFARSVAQLAEFFDLCNRKGVRVRVDKDQIDTSTATGQLVANVLASLAQFEADAASERVKDAFAAKRLKDPDWPGGGQRPYGEKAGEDTSVVRAAFREAGSYDGAAKILNRDGVSPRVRGRLWSGTVVRDVVRRQWPDDVLPQGRRGSPAGRRDFRLSGLLACSVCVERARVSPGAGIFMTGSYDKRRDEVRYACSRSRVLPHPRGWVNEDKILPGVREEAELARIRIGRRRKGSAEDEARLAALATKRARVLENYEDGLYVRAERDRRLASIAEEEGKLTAARWVRTVTLPPDVGEGDPARVNAYLRRIFRSVTVDMSEKAHRGPSSWMATLDFEWVDPTLRHEGGPDDNLLVGQEGERNVGTEG